jgi:hypothetical protein
MRVCISATKKKTQVLEKEGLAFAIMPQLHLAGPACHWPRQPFCQSPAGSEDQPL